MQGEIGNGGKLSRTCIWLYAKLSSWWGRYIFYPVLVSAPVGLVLANFSEHQLRQAVQSRQPDWLTTIINNNPFLAFVAAFVYITILNGLYGIVKVFGKNEIDPKRLLTLLRLIREVVSQKAQRFEQAAHRFAQSDNVNGSTIFREITQPDQQIAACIQALYSYLCVINNHKHDFRVVLASIKDGALDSWYCSAPADDPPMTDIEDLRQDSTINEALRTRSMVVVEDTKDAKASNEPFVPTRPGGINERGSLLCAPIIDDFREIPFIVCISCDEPKYFRKNNKRFYHWVLRHFFLRVRLENSLLCMKQSVG